MAAIQPSPGADVALVSKELPAELLIFTLQERPVFPGMPFPLVIQDPDMQALIKQAVEQEQGYMGVILRNPAAAAMEEGEISRTPPLFEVGTAIRIFRVVPMPGDSIQVLGQGLSRFEYVQEVQSDPFLRWQVAYVPDPETASPNDLKPYTMAVANKVKELLSLNPVFQEQLKLIASQLNFEQPGLMMDILASMLPIEGVRLQELLETYELEDRARLLLELLNEQTELARLQQKITQQIEEKMTEQQKEFFLREQLKAIKQELGLEKDDQTAATETYAANLEGKSLNPEAEKAIQDEINKLQTLDPRSPEFNVSRTWLDVITDLPWGIYSEEQTDISQARKILDRDHYGLDEVKDLILEFLSTLIRRGRMSGSIICLVGPPGVGKTSIGHSIASALGRKFYRFSLGGMRDEAEIKGHRRTYIGALPGKFISSLRRTGTANPVLMLDELDKIGSSFQGDPASALLEVLDPEQNSSFLDHYLDVPFDLSKVLFIATANQLDTIPGPLLDRMEVIRLPGYILEEKVQIARRYLLPKQLKEHGYKKSELNLTDAALAMIVDKYAREAGVRNLEKQIRKIVRKVTLLQAEGKEVPKRIGKSQVENFLGKPIFTTETLYNKGQAGVALGLAYTSMGGATLYIEATGIRGQNGFQLTGQLGDVMRESAQIAYSLVQALLSTEQPPNDYFAQHKVHLHVPAGATPKDGPSAGITMALALYSLATGQVVHPDLAMTGELTLTGKVLPIGGVREKTIAARRVNISTLIFPQDNQRDFEDLPDYIREGLTVHFADRFTDILQLGLTPA